MALETGTTAPTAVSGPRFSVNHRRTNNNSIATLATDNMVTGPRIQLTDHQD